VKPDLSATFLGGAYLSAAVMEFGAARERIWANARVAVPAVLIFTLLTLFVTLGNVDQYHFKASGLVQSVGTWAWLVVYVVVPPLLMVVLFAQLRRGGSDPGRLQPIHGALRVVLVVGGVGLTVGGVILLIDPGNATWMWPWGSSSLTGRAFGAWMVGFGVAMAHIAWEADWRRVRPATAGAGVLGVLQIIAMLRYLDEPAWDAPQTWLYGGVMLSFIVLGAFGWHKASSLAEPDPDRVVV
jgi:hypothetical protein